MQTNNYSAPEIEQKILGAILLDNNSLDSIAQIITPKCFSEEKNKLIFSIMLQMYDSGIPIDTVSLHENLKRSGSNGHISPGYLFKLTGEAYSAANSAYHSKIIYEKWLQRELISKLEIASSKVKSDPDDIFELHSRIVEELETLTNELEHLDSDKNMIEGFDDTMKRIEERYSQEKGTGLHSVTFPSFNKFTGGIRESDFLAAYGDYKQGKTTFAFQLGLDFALHHKIPVGIFSLEMDKESLNLKAYSLRTGIDYQKLRAPKENNLAPEEFQDFIKKAQSIFKDSKIYICDQVLNKNQIKAKMKYWKKKFGIGFFIVDYISLIQNIGKFERRDLEISELSRFFKLACKELKTPIMMLSQSNKEGITAESKGLARDADFVIYISKPKEKGIAPVEYDKNQWYNFIDEDFLVQLKHSRHGRNGFFFVCRFLKNMFVEIDLRHTNQKEVIPRMQREYEKEPEIF